MARILIVDDEDDICQILAYSLQTAGYETTIAHSAEEAIPLVRACAPDLILLDIMLDGMSGTQMAAYLRDEGLMTMPVIFLTALSGYRHQRQGQVAHRGRHAREHHPQRTRTTLLPTDPPGTDSLAQPVAQRRMARCRVCTGTHRGRTYYPPAAQSGQVCRASANKIGFRVYLATIGTKK